MPRRTPYPAPHPEIPYKLRRNLKPWLRQNKIFAPLHGDPTEPPTSQSPADSVLGLWRSLVHKHLEVPAPVKELPQRDDERPYKYPYELQNNRILLRLRNPSRDPPEEERKRLDEIGKAAPPPPPRFLSVMSKLKKQ